jgi:hypothetical protein
MARAGRLEDLAMVKNSMRPKVTLVGSFEAWRMGLDLKVFMTAIGRVWTTPQAGLHSYLFEVSHSSFRSSDISFTHLTSHHILGCSASLKESLEIWTRDLLYSQKHQNVTTTSHDYYYNTRGYRAAGIFSSDQKTNRHVRPNRE